ncbi:3-hydroxyalkanoate synthetase [Labrys miyagiensis]
MSAGRVANGVGSRGLFDFNPMTAFWPTGWNTTDKQGERSGTAADLLVDYADYLTDAAQRGILFLDVLRQRGNQAIVTQAREAPNVLSFDAEVILDGRDLPKAVNYALLRIVPPDGMTVDPAKRPFIVFDPRAGHGPGIAGMKQDSEIGEAMQAGHPCYFVGFLPVPVPGQTIEDICTAEAAFVRKVTELHPEAPGAPALIANCQAGWQVMIMAALHPELPGPILIAGAPLSYWAGNRGKAPLRYLGGLLGGTWLTALSGDVGAGIFDGANLVANFESMNPANTYFRKNYNVFDNVDSEAPRFLGFEAWWGNPVLLNAEEMQWIADNLFVGNKLTSGGIVTSDDVRVDLRNIRSPIVVFCSWGDDITPPAQALAWITDMYEHEKDIVAAGQTIVYCVHETIGHLGIFVSGKVASREHGEFASCMEMIDLMPPGLYEAVIEEVDDATAHPELIHGKYLFRLEVRTLDHIRAFGDNPPEDDRRFATVARVSEINNGLYRTFLQPAVRASVTGPFADALRRMNAHRLRYAAFSDMNPLVEAVKPFAQAVHENRRPVREDNPFRRLEHSAAEIIEASWKNYGAMLDTWKEAAFLTVYGSRALQAAVGMPESDTDVTPRLARSVIRETVAAKAELDLRSKLSRGGPVEALLRSVNYIHRADRMVDERAFAALARYQDEIAREGISFERFKEILHDQALIVGLDAEAALETLPRLLPEDVEERRKLLDTVRRVADAVGTLSSATAERLARIEAIFDIPLFPAAPPPDEEQHPSADSMAEPAGEPAPPEAPSAPKQPLIQDSTAQAAGEPAPTEVPAQDKPAATKPAAAASASIRTSARPSTARPKRTPSRKGKEDHGAE